MQLTEGDLVLLVGFVVVALPSAWLVRRYLPKATPLADYLSDSERAASVRRHPDRVLRTIGNETFKRLRFLLRPAPRSELVLLHRAALAAVLLTLVVGLAILWRWMTAA